MVGYNEGKMKAGSRTVSPIPPITTSSAEATTTHALIITKILTLVAGTSKVLVLTALTAYTGATSVLHSCKHGAHGGWIHLVGVHTRGSHHLLHHGLHIRWHTVHTRHPRHGTSSAGTAHAGHASHHHHLHLFHYLLLVLCHGVLAVFRADAILLCGIQGPRELVKSVVEVVAEISTGLPPRLIILGKICS